MHVEFDVKKYLDQMLDAKKIDQSKRNELYEFDLLGVFKHCLAEEIETQLAAGRFVLHVEVYYFAEYSLEYVQRLIDNCNKLANGERTLEVIELTAAELTGTVGEPRPAF